MGAGAPNQAAWLLLQSLNFNTIRQNSLPIRLESAMHTRLKIPRVEHSINSARTGAAAAGKLTAAVSEAGGRGLIGGLRDAEWLIHELSAAR